MSYEDKNGNTLICPGPRNKLSITFDDMGEGIFPVFLFVPYVKEHEHDHIELTNNEAEILYNWLGKYLDNPKLGLVE